jgi:pilus assembly protein Flp/PilA
MKSYYPPSTAQAISFYSANPDKQRHPKIEASSCQQGQGLVEYALLLALVALIVIAILSLLGGKVGAAFQEVNCALADYPASSPPLTILSVTRVDEDTIRMRFRLSSSTQVTFWDTNSGFHETFDLGAGTYNWITDDDDGNGHGEPGPGTLTANTGDGQLVCGRYMN